MVLTDNIQLANLGRGMQVVIAYTIKTSSPHCSLVLLQCRDLLIAAQ